jgi:hypothetical protein
MKITRMLAATLAAGPLAGPAAEAQADIRTSAAGGRANRTYDPSAPGRNRSGGRRRGPAEATSPRGRKRGGGPVARAPQANLPARAAGRSTAGGKRDPREPGGRGNPPPVRQDSRAPDGPRPTVSWRWPA